MSKNSLYDKLNFDCQKKSFGGSVEDRRAKGMEIFNKYKNVAVDKKAMGGLLGAKNPMSNSSSLNSYKMGGAAKKSKNK
jgi:hypothetical protein